MDYELGECPPTANCLKQLIEKSTNNTNQGTHLMFRSKQSLQHRTNLKLPTVTKGTSINYKSNIDQCFV